MERIEDRFACADGCPRCDGTGAVCEDHPDRPFADCCGAAGMPCRPEARS